jgi:hypothetical protein
MFEKYFLLHDFDHKNLETTYLNHFWLYFLLLAAKSFLIPKRLIILATSSKCLLHARHCFKPSLRSWVSHFPHFIREELKQRD